MNSKVESPISSIPWRMLGSIAGIGGMFLLLLLAVPKSESPNDQADVNGGMVDAAKSSAAQCEQDLTRILTAMRPGSQGITADRIELVNQINNWQDTCGKLEDAQAQIVRDGDLLKRLLSPEDLDWVQHGRFVPQDSSYIRMCFLAQSIVNSIAIAEKSDRNRVVKLFDYVQKYVGLAPGLDAGTTTLTPYEALLFGRGTAAHQAWVFASLLRQLRIDAVILRPAAQEKQNLWLVAVLLPRSGALLFDPQLGMLIPSLQQSDESFFPQLPATLEEARSDNQVFRQLDIPNGPAYPWTSEDLQDVNVELIGEPSSWSPRMARVQYLLAAEFTVDLFDGLGDNDLRQPGHWDRIREAGATHGWQADHVKPWRFPGEQWILLEQSLKTDGSAVAATLQVFSGPIVSRQDPRTGTFREGPIDHPLHQVRIDQLLGNHARAINDYVRIRSTGVNTQIPMNQEAADHAEFWIGVSQFELARYKPALDSLTRYMEARPGGGLWSAEAAHWVGRCLMATQQHSEAIAWLSGSPNPNRLHRDTYLVQRWTHMLKGTAAPEKQQDPTP